MTALEMALRRSCALSVTSLSTRAHLRLHGREAQGLRGLIRVELLVVCDDQRRRWLRATYTSGPRARHRSRAAA